MNIRTARPDDFQALIPLFQQIHEQHVALRPDHYRPHEMPVSEDLFLSQLDRSDFEILVAEYKGLAGVIVLKEDIIEGSGFVFDKHYLRVISLVVADTHQKQGVGKRLMQAAYAHAKTIGCDRIELGVDDANQEAIAFYEALGMSVRSRRMEWNVTSSRETTS
ncbi:MULTISPECIES: GNAT family N-acetyltransferase [unclassified Exiguobacterium]|uniref:GNAT family N-acetyltransferase n=1 Tax=unclassified Exiguobacterium TaxID=2644629 RepID=UPI0004529198|nr:MULTISPECIES: GNAT family N-acetyltransferase [unclassified Exiguobacterium]EZP61291.1 Acetyltransferase [Exiguobacterium sp. RIT341]